MSTVTLERAVEVAAHRDLCEHEAAHATAGMLTGLRIEAVHAPPATFERLTTEPENPDDPAGFSRFNIRTVEGDRTQARAYAISVLAAPLHEGKSAPEWPLSVSDAATTDHAQVVRVVRLLNLDRQGYRRLVKDATDLVCSRRFERLHVAIAFALERHGRLDEQALNKIKAIAVGGRHGMERKRPDAILRDRNGTEVWNMTRRGWPPSSVVDYSGEIDRKRVDDLARELEPPNVATFEA